MRLIQIGQTDAMLNPEHVTHITREKFGEVAVVHLVSGNVVNVIHDAKGMSHDEQYVDLVNQIQRGLGHPEEAFHVRVGAREFSGALKGARKMEADRG